MAKKRKPQRKLLKRRKKVLKSRKRRRNPDLNAFNTQLAKEFKKLKKDLKATNIRQNYKGTGSQSHRRQLWVSLPNDGTIDIWLDSGFVGLGGVVVNRPKDSKGSGRPTPRISYGDKTPEQVYGEALSALKVWIDGPSVSSRKKRRKKK